MNQSGVVHPFLALRPSPLSLRESLVRLNICRDRDFRRCRRRVRRLARGIPAFDFVWIDALLHAGILTSYQAKVLETSSPEALRLGPCILLDRLGRGDISETFLARTPGGFDNVVLKRLRPGDERTGPALDRLRLLIERLRGLDNPFVMGPHFADRHRADLIVLSRHAAGPNCRELLVRRGRFPVDVVAQIARQLAAGLAALESRACLHGQINLANVRLTAAGEAVLVDAGVAGALERGLLVRADVTPELYEGIAPELIGTGSLKTTASELYAFGCLLWQLLAGRPPFPTGDPLGKLAAHQSRAVPDIREFAPDTHAPLADAICSLTQRDPRRRPTTAAEVTARFGNANNAAPRRLSRFVRQFDTAAPLERLPAERGSRFSAAAVLTVLLVLSGAALTLSGTDVNRQILWLRSAASPLLSRPNGPPIETARSPAVDARRSRRPPSDQLWPLPSPNADGVVVLQGGPYEAGTLSYVGDLTIRGVGSTASLIVVRNQALKVVCRKFAMDHVVVREEKSRAFSESALGLLAVRSQEMLLERCTFVIDGAADSRRAAIVWSGIEARDPDAGHIRLANTAFLNAGSAVACASVPGRLEADNCLTVGGALFDLRDGPAARDVAISARHVTLRRADSLCRMKFGKTAPRKVQVRAVLDECVFDLCGRQAGLFLVTSDRMPSRRDPPLIVTGAGSVIRADVPIAAWINPSAPGRSPAELSNAVVEGLAAGEFQFVGQSVLRARDSVLNGRSLQIPRRSDVLPGIVAERFTFVVPPGRAQVRADRQGDSHPLSN